MILLTEEFGLAWGEEIAARFVDAGVFTGSFDALVDDVEFAVGEEELDGLIMWGFVPVFNASNQGIEEGFVMTEGCFADAAQQVAGFLWGRSCGIE